MRNMLLFCAVLLALALVAAPTIGGSRMPTPAPQAYEHANHRATFQPKMTSMALEDDEIMDLIDEILEELEDMSDDDWDEIMDLWDKILEAPVVAGDVPVDFIGAAFGDPIVAGDVPVDFIGAAFGDPIVAGDVPVDFIGAAFGDPVVFVEGSEGDGMSHTDSKRALEAFVGSNTKSLKKGERVALVGFGSFSVTKRSGKTGRDSQTGETIRIPDKKVVKFKAGSDLAKTVK